MTRIDLPDPNFGKKPYYCPKYHREVMGVLAFAVMLPVFIILPAVIFAPELAPVWDVINSINPLVAFALTAIFCAIGGVVWLVKFIKK